MERLLDGCCHYFVGCHGEGSLESSRVVLGIPRGNCGSFRGVAFRGYWENSGNIKESQHVGLSEDTQRGIGRGEGCLKGLGVS